MSEIVAYTRRDWSDGQAERYVQQLESACQLLADNPLLGRKWGSVRAALRRSKFKAT